MTHRFSLFVSKNGTISLPAGSNLSGKKVDVIIVDSEGDRAKKPARAFGEKWAGFLKSSENGDARFDHIMKKHR